jgi:transcriptional regulator with XRE-family HTH domain
MLDLKRVNLRIEMYKRNLNQTTLVKKSGVKRYRISMILAGTGYPTNSEKQAIALALGINADDRKLFAVSE